MCQVELDDITVIKLRFICCKFNSHGRAIGVAMWDSRALDQLTSIKVSVNCKLLSRHYLYSRGRFLFYPQDDIRTDLPNHMSNKINIH